MRVTSTVIFTALVIVMLVTARDLLIPFVLAVFLWHLIRSLAQAFRRLPLGGWCLPPWAALTLALVTIVGAASVVGQIVGANIQKLVQVAPDYQVSLEQKIAEGFDRFGIDRPPTVETLVSSFEVSEIVAKSAAALAGLVGQAGLVAVYLFFLFIEEKMFRKKLDMLFPRAERRARFNRLLDRLGRDTRTYLALKSLVSLVVAVSSYALMAAVGLDFAGFWALLIFILNFIPNIGSIVATTLPSLQALVQFDDLWRVLFVIIGITALQFLVAYILEPRFLSSSLNLSPLAVILSLVLWSVLWGVPGMFLAVPIMVNLMIVCSLFPSTRPIAVLMSRDGSIAE
ncbi:MAG: AI-2E family transporter [bacterium]|nr:AI-2E family transporter [bacterium]